MSPPTAHHASPSPTRHVAAISPASLSPNPAQKPSARPPESSKPKTCASSLPLYVGHSDRGSAQYSLHRPDQSRPHHICSPRATAIPLGLEAGDFSSEQIRLNFVLSNG